jgi:hypothetical protein
VKWRLIAVLLCFALSSLVSAQSVDPAESSSDLWSLLNQKLDDLQTSFDQQASLIASLQNQLTDDRLLLTKQSESLAQAQIFSETLEKSLSSSRRLNEILGWAGGISFAIATIEGIIIISR